MASSSTTLLLAFYFILIAAPLIISVNAGGDHDYSDHIRMSRCQGSNGSIGECMAEDEFAMDSETNKRIFATSKSNFIYYGAVESNTVPCSERGSSSKNCKPPAPSNPYNRGCSDITRCRS